MKPNNIITCNIHNYEDMSVEEINALIDRLCGLRQDKLTERAEQHAEKLINLICEIMDDGFVVYYNGMMAIEPSDLDVRVLNKDKEE